MPAGGAAAAPGAGRRSPRCWPGRWSTSRWPCSPPTTGPGSSCFSQQRPANPETIWNIALTSATTDPRRPLAEGQAPTILNAVVTVVLVLLAGGVGWLTLAAPLAPGSPRSRSCCWPASCCSTRSGARSPRCGCCRWRCWPDPLADAAAVAGDRGDGLGGHDAATISAQQTRDRRPVVLPRGPAARHRRPLR